MRILEKIFSNFSSKIIPDYLDEKKKYIFYKIIDFAKNDYSYILQCISTNAIFYSDLLEIVFDIDILYNLHPIQSCYIGIEYVKYLKEKKSFNYIKKKNYNKKTNIIYRYGLYNLNYQDRKGNIFFTNTKTQQIFNMDPCDLALSEELIKNFDASQAFYIGMISGLRLSNTVSDNHFLHRISAVPYLQLVK